MLRYLLSSLSSLISQMLGERVKTVFLPTKNKLFLNLCIQGVPTIKMNQTDANTSAAVDEIL